MKIGELAQSAGVPIDTVRYYERQGLLPEAVLDRTLVRLFTARYRLGTMDAAPPAASP